MAHESGAPATLARTALIVIGVLGLQLGFIGSYVGGLHGPRAKDVPVVVVAPAALQDTVVDRLQASGALKATDVADEATARRDIARRKAYAALLVGKGGPTTDRLLLASAASYVFATALRQDLVDQEHGLHRTVQLEDVAPLPSSDPLGLSGFYLVIGWVVGGYLLATVMGLLRGFAAAGRRLVLARLSTYWVFSVASGILGAVLVGPGLHVFHHHLVGVALVGMLLVFGVTVTTSALVGAFGILGTGAAIALFVVLGNPSAGGPFARELLPPFWRAIGSFLPPGAGTTLVRLTVYFPEASVTGPVLVLVTYVVIGIAGTWAATEIAQRRLAAAAPGAAPTVAEAA